MSVPCQDVAKSRFKVNGELLRDLQSPWTLPDVEHSQIGQGGHKTLVFSAVLLGMGFYFGTSERISRVAAMGLARCIEWRALANWSR